LHLQDVGRVGATWVRNMKIWASFPIRKTGFFLFVGYIIFQLCQRFFDRFQG